MKPKFISLQTKVAAFFLAAFLLVLVPVNFLMYKEVEVVIQETNRRELVNETERLYNLFKLEPIVIPVPSENSLLKIQIRHANELEEIFSSPGFPYLYTQDLQLPVFYTDTFEVATLTKPLPYSSKELIFSLARSNTVFLKKTNQLRIYLYGIFLLTLIATSALVYFVSRWLLRPLKQMAAQTTSITNSATINFIETPTSNDELSQLGNAINQMLERLKHSASNQINFFASAAHELRTPLALMKAEITNPASENPETKLLHVLEEVSRLERIIHDFLMISELKSDSLAIRKKPTLFVELVYEALKKLKLLAQRYNSVLLFHTDEKTVSQIIQADADKIETVLINLIENAIKHAPQKSKIELKLTSQDGELQFSIINPVDKPIENTQELLKEFKKTDDQSGGIGMGLWLCESIISKHGDKIVVDYINGQFSAHLFLKI
jgi:signal transduction histidine kinase